jgi:aryl-alcohol dehydrogenase-like predicted oxidoreductase
MTGVPRFTFEPLGVTTSRVGLGCGSLVGRDSFRAAARLVETALDLGIRYFDTAPLYGMGTAEEVLGAVVGSDPDVVIATKIGISRPSYSPLKAALRRYAKPLLDRSRPLKSFARSLIMRSRSGRTAAPAEPVLRDFSAAAVHRSLEESLRLLKRSRADVYLPHDPSAGDLTPATAEVFQALVAAGTIGCFGAAITAGSPLWPSFGSVRRLGWAGRPGEDFPPGLSYVFHGTIRTAAKDRFGRAVVAPSTLLRAAMAEAPHALFLVGASTPEKLRRIVAEVVA